MAFEEFIKDFIAESSETLAGLDEAFVELERNPKDRERLDRIYGAIHTIKGTAGFFAFSRLEKIAHAGESLLTCLVEGRLTPDSEIITALLAMVDAVRAMLDEVDRTGKDGTEEFQGLVDRLNRLRDGEPYCANAHAETVLEEVPVPPLPGEPGIPEAVPVMKPPPLPVPAQSPTSPEPDSLRVTGTLELTEEATGEFDFPDPATPDKAVAPGKPALKDVLRPRSSSTIRVSVELLDKLMSLVGELVLSRNQVVQVATSVPDRATALAFQQLDLITTELQQAVMKTRMQPIANIFKKFPRVVRDMALACEKEVDLTLEGEETELDKSLLEAISAPLTHIVRNSVDHGLETPSVRAAAGKSRVGSLRLIAAHESGHVTIRVVDDGRGIDLETIRRKAVEKRLMSAEQAKTLEDEELVRLIFTPAFSTAEKVTNLSGRGFGMDVVRSTLEGVGGTVDVTTRPGQGTTVQLKIPLTLAIIPALIVSSGGERYAIPQVNLLEAVHLKEDDTDGVELISETPVYRLRGRLLPLADLGYELGRTPRRDYGGEQAVVNIVVLNVDGREFGLVVDRIADTQEIVVKPISRLVKGNSCFAGATIMDDGKPALILDVPGLAKRSRVLSADADELHTTGDTDREGREEGRETVLLFQLAGYGRMAMSLSKVGRLELFPHSRVEWIGERAVIQYRDQVMPLVPVGTLLGIGNGSRLHEPSPEPLSAIVCQHEERWIGLVVDHILDIVEERVRVEPGSRRPGLLGTAVLKGQVTELLDPEALFQQAGIDVKVPALAAAAAPPLGKE